MEHSSSAINHLAALILARGGSKGIPMKNIVNVGGLPLICWVLRAAIDSNAFDSDEVAEVASSYEVVNIHRRSDEVSKDNTSSMESTEEFLKYHPEIDAIGLLQATTPCIQPSQLVSAAEMIKIGGFDSVFSVVRRHFFRWKEVKQGEVTHPLNFDPSHRPRRQDWAGELCENGGFYFAKTSVIRQGLFQGGRTGYQEMPLEHSVDIDTPFDLVVADYVINKYGYKGK